MINPLHQILEQDTISIFKKGYTYLKTKLLPTIAQSDVSKNQSLLSEAYCIIGDIHDFNGAPEQAIKAYQQAIHFDASHAVAYQEMANALAQIGRYFEAFQAINLAIEQDSNNPELISDKAAYQDDMNYDVEPLFNPNNPVWKYCELLAEEQFDWVIAQISKTETRDIDLLKCLNRAYGALEQNDLYLTTWQKMKALEADFEMDYGDWFYMPRAVYDMEEMVLLRADSDLWD